MKRFTNLAWGLVGVAILLTFLAGILDIQEHGKIRPIHLWHDALFILVLAIALVCLP
jgi:uncharacterized membrane protein